MSDAVSFRGMVVVVVVVVVFVMLVAEIDATCATCDTHTPTTSLLGNLPYHWAGAPLRMKDPLSSITVSTAWGRPVLGSSCGGDGCCGGGDGCCCFWLVVVVVGVIIGVVVVVAVGDPCGDGTVSTWTHSPDGRRRCGTPGDPDDPGEKEGAGRDGNWKWGRGGGVVALVLVLVLAVAVAVAVAETTIACPSRSLKSPLLPLTPPPAELERRPCATASAMQGAATTIRSAPPPPPHGSSPPYVVVMFWMAATAVVKRSSWFSSSWSCERVIGWWRPERAYVGFEGGGEGGAGQSSSKAVTQHHEASKQGNWSSAWC